MAWSETIDYNGYLAPYLDKIEELYEAGKTTKEIAEALHELEAKSACVLWYGDSPNRREQNVRAITQMVRFVLNKAGCRPVPRPDPSDDVAQVRRWGHLLPPNVACEQARWEHLRAMRRAHLDGATYHEIAAREGISGGRVAQLLNMVHITSPLERWLKIGTERMRKRLIDKDKGDAENCRATTHDPRFQARQDVDAIAEHERERERVHQWAIERRQREAEEIKQRDAHFARAVREAEVDYEKAMRSFLAEHDKPPFADDEPKRPDGLWYWQ